MPLSLMDSWVKEIADLQYLLTRKGVAFLLLITPSKAAIYPEYIPRNLCRARPSIKRDYDSFVPLLDRHRINYVDGHVITQQATQIEKALLFCQGGLHWNNLGAYYTARAVIDELNGLLIILPHGSKRISPNYSIYSFRHSIMRFLTLSSA